MRIVRNSASTGFTQVPNVAVRDKRLSYKARGLLAVLLSHKDGWQIDAHALADDSPDGRKTILSGLRELVDCGYVVYVNRRGEDGRMRKEMTVYEVPPSPPSGPDEKPVDNSSDRGSKTAPRSAENSQVAPRSPHGTSVHRTSVHRTSVHGTCIEDQQEDQKEDHPEDQRAAQKISQSARVAEAERFLSETYGLTDEEAAAAWKVVLARAPEPVRNPLKYLKGSTANGSLADVVGAIQTRTDEHPTAPEPEAEPPPPDLRSLPGGATSSAPATQPSLFVHAVPDVPDEPAEPAVPVPAQQPPRDLGLPDAIVIAALAHLTMGGFPYQAAAARWFAANNPGATEAQVNAYALQLAWDTPKDRDALRGQPGIAAALDQTG